MLGAAIVHPDEKVVLPLAPEPIIKGDGIVKNDCERNAAKRLLTDFRREHPYLKAIVIEDGLAANYPHLALLDDLNLPYIISVQPGDHDFLFDWVKHAQLKAITLAKDHHKYILRYLNDVPLNDVHFDYHVNFLECIEERPNGERLHFTWITKWIITADNVFKLMRAGRARWRIENETFNTLKNMGYNFEHNYCHGYNNLCTNFTMLMLLAFLIDQVQLLCCKLYQKFKRRERLWHGVFERIRGLFIFFTWDSWQQLYEYWVYQPLGTET